jgi:ferredoxin
VIAGMSDLKNFCTGCDYCKGCPKNIEISSLMQKRNNLIFEPGLNDLEQSERIFCSPDETWIPATPDNPCIRCGACEKSCTQRLPIVKALDDVYRRVNEGSFSLPSRREKLATLLNDKGYTRVGLCPSGGFANMIMRLYRQFFGEPSFEWVQFNGDDRLQGELSGGLPIHSTRSIGELRPDTVLVGTIRYANTYYEALKHYQEQGIVIQKFNEGGEIPWVY